VIPQLIRLGLVALVFNLGGGIIAPVLPLYARSLGADYRDLGLIGAAYGIAFAGLTIPLGRASDRFGRRTLLLVAALSMAVATVCYLAARGVLGLILGKLLEAVGWAAFWPALEAWVAEQFGTQAGTAMGVVSGSYATAFVLGTSAAGFVMESAGLRAPFVIYLGTALGALGLLLAMPIHRMAREPEGAGRAGRPPARAKDDGAARRNRILAYGTGFVYVFGLGAVFSFLPAYASDRGFTPHAVGLLLGAYWSGRVVASFTTGRLSDRWGRRAILVPALLGSAIGAALVAAPLGAAVLVLGTLILGLTAGACAPACIGLIADHTVSENRGFAMGLFESSCGVSFILAGFLGGQAAYALGAEVPYLLVAGLAVAWAPILAWQLAGRPVGRAAV
jgi:DHA1 family multidrug resistance protein-like MFS transporter